MKKYFFIFLASLLFNFLFSQGRIYFLPSMDSANPNLHYCTDGSFRKNELVYKMAAAPVELKKALPENIELEKGLNLAVNSFQFEHLSYGQILDGYTFFALGNHSVFRAVKQQSDDPVKDDSVALASCKKTFFTKRNLFEVLYNWAMPVYQNAFSIMSYKEQRDILAHLNEALSYTENFVLAKEKYDLDTMGSSFAFHKGKLHAFIFRRIYNNELAQEECVSWLKRIINDLAKVQPRKHTPEDELVLKANVGYGYFLCTEWMYAGHRNGRTRIGRFKNGKFTLVPDIEFEMTDATNWGLVAGRDISSKHRGNVIMQFDTSASYHILPLKKRSYPKTYFMLSSVNTPRMLVLVGLSEDQSRGEFILYDLNNSTQVGENFTMSITASEDPNTNGIIYMLLPDQGAYIIKDVSTGKYGLMDLNGKILINPVRDNITKGKKYGQFKVDGKKYVIPA